MDTANLTPGDVLPAHSDLGASGMDRWSRCPGSFGLSQHERHRMPSIHAATGTVAHALVEEAIAVTARGDDVVALLRAAEGTTSTVDGHTVVVDSAMTDGVVVMLDYVHQRARELGVAPLIEQTVFVDGYFPPNEPPAVRMFGRSDCQFLTPDLLEIVDYKNGSGVTVNVVDHPQLLFYAAGALAAIAAANKPEPPWVMLTVVQPNTRSAQKIRSYKLTGLDVVMWVHDVLIPAARACEEPDAGYTPGRWCRFCPVTHACPALLKDAQTAARLQFDDSAEADVIADRLDIAERAILWGEAMRGFALERLKAGLHVPGWDTEPTRPRRAWTQPEIVKSMLTAQNIDPLEHKIATPAQLEKRVGKNSRSWRLIEPYVESKSSGVRLTRVAADGQRDDDESLFDLIET